MSIKERLAADLKQAMKQGDRPRIACLRMLKSKIQEREVALRSKETPEVSLGDEETLAVVAAYAKQRRDSIDSFVLGGREELAQKEREELQLVEQYLPKQLDDEELRGIVAEAVRESGASSAREMGAVMKLVMPRVKGLADGKRVQALVREALG